MLGTMEKPKIRIPVAKKPTKVILPKTTYNRKHKDKLPEEEKDNES